tara:strand:- start:3422 stop:4810 length:1389 start_codon:yes stop_codon:yes gene_type:complete
MKNFFLILSSILIVSACTVGPDYQSPDLNPPQQFPSQEVFALLNNGKQGDFDSDQWWKGFNDPVLNDLVDNAILENYDIAIAAARLKQAQANVRFFDAGDRLRASTNIGAEVQNSRGDGENDTSTSLAGGLAAVLPLDIFGQNKRETEAATAQLESFEAALRGSVLNVSTDVATEYLTLRGNQRQLELLRESVQLQEKTLSIVNSRYEAGLSPELDLQRARTSVENLRADIPLLEQSLNNSRNQLAVLTGNYPGFYDDLLSGTSPVPEYTSSFPLLVPYDVLLMRPDVAQAESDLKQAVANIGVAEANFYPVFELSGGIRLTSTGINGLPVTDVIVSSINALIEQTLLDGGARKANFDIAVAQAEEQLAVYEQTLRNAILNVETSLTALQSSKDRQISLEKSVQSSQRSFAQAETLYQQGLISFLDVVDAQRQFASAEQSLARETTNYATQIAQLFNSLGIQ